MTSIRKLCCLVTGNLQTGNIRVPCPTVTREVTFPMAILITFTTTSGGSESRDAIPQHSTELRIFFSEEIELTGAF